jgi:hypothetical protein
MYYFGSEAPQKHSSSSSRIVEEGEEASFAATNMTMYRPQKKNRVTSDSASVHDDGAIRDMHFFFFFGLAQLGQLHVASHCAYQSRTPKSPQERHRRVGLWVLRCGTGLLDGCAMVVLVMIDGILNGTGPDC